MTAETRKYRSALQNLVNQTRRFLSMAPKGHPERHNAIIAHRAACEMSERACDEGEHEYRAELLAELKETYEG